MRGLPVVVVVVVLVQLLGTHALADEIAWSGDGRTVLVVELDSVGDLTLMRIATSIVDLATGKRDESTGTRSSCQSADPSFDYNACDRERTKNDKDFERFVAKWKKDHGAVGGVRHTNAESDAAVVRETDSPDGQWTIVETMDGETATGFVVKPKSARVDVLDAGAGNLEATNAALAKIGVTAAHTGKAQSAHAKTEVFYAVGFAPDAKRIADALHADAKPVTWSTAYAITVAVAKQAP